MIMSMFSNLQIGVRTMSYVIQKILLHLTIEVLLECLRKKVYFRKIVESNQEEWLEKKLKQQFNKIQ